MSEKKRFIIRKYVMAESASDAIRQDKKTVVDDVWVDEKWNEENIKKSFIGFKEKQ